MFKTVTAAAAVMMTAALVVPTVSHAQDVKSVKVSYADLNLASAPGEQKLQSRIAFAAHVVCNMGESSRELDLASATKACRSATLADVQPAFEAAVSAARRGTVTVGEAAALILSAQ